MLVSLALLGAQAASAPAPAPAPPPAADWRLVSLADDTLVFVDKSSVRPDGGRVAYTAWTFYKEASAHGDNYRLVLSADCAARTTRTLGLTFYRGDAVSGRAGPDPEERAVEPGSLGADLLLYACGTSGREETPTIADPAAAVRRFWSARPQGAGAGE
ncbi:hypothetical protein E2493_20945 [Sphingomonas parva]|uniref:Surface-adhesin protein E-like domain-containing protein n=1 Tax=Sphingomonas parva TaxID=2555898 RepID=A0A4Y8ZJW2_9SPHN|nr:surface-adhesin E family protein [Sphingomonas parva]TFI56291.1 hypothetical protein E2493_20945 [Sphingomonas parva]